MRHVSEYSVAVPAFRGCSLTTRSAIAKDCWRIYIITRMSGSSSVDYADGSSLRLDRQDPYLRIQSVTIFVRDQDRSLRFYLDQLGFRLVYDSRHGPGERWVAFCAPGRHRTACSYHSQARL
jgi:Glyoxalase/Bleomycin resistance protein/Dioxygenase superfamily